MEADERWCVPESSLLTVLLNDVSNNRLGRRMTTPSSEEQRSGDGGRGRSGRRSEESSSEVRSALATHAEMIPANAVLEQHRIHKTDSNAIDMITRYHPDSGYIQMAYLNARWGHTTCCIFHPTEPFVVAAGGRGFVGVWNHDQPKSPVSRFRTHGSRHATIESLEVINATSLTKNCLLLAASSDGVIKIYQGAFSAKKKSPSESGKEQPSSCDAAPPQLVCAFLANANHSAHVGWPFLDTFDSHWTHTRYLRDAATGFLLNRSRLTAMSRVRSNPKLSRDAADEKLPAAPPGGMRHVSSTASLSALGRSKPTQAASAHSYHSSRGEKSHPPPPTGMRHAASTACLSALASAHHATRNHVHAHAHNGPLPANCKRVAVKWSQSAGDIVSTSPLSKYYRVWDMTQQLCVREELNPSLEQGGNGSASAIVDIERDRTGRLLFTGHLDGSVRMLDLRLKAPAATGACTLLRTPHSLQAKESHVIGLHLQRGGIEGGLLMAATNDGAISSLDLRMMQRQPNLLRKPDARDPLSSFAVHDYAPLMAVGSQDQQIHLSNIHSGELLDTIKFHVGFLGIRIGAVQSLNFHPTRILLAAGSADSGLSIYSGDLRHQTKL